MSVSLLDVNVLVALLDPLHQHHEDAHRWFGRNRTSGWATCPITLNGCLRIVTNTAYPRSASLPEVAGQLRISCATEDHQFWPDSVSLLDDTLFRLTKLRGHQKITDAYLLGLSVRNHGRLVTFDQSIPLEAVQSAGNRHLVVIPRS